MGLHDAILQAQVEAAIASADHPRCNFCPDSALYDFVVAHANGAWAFGCQADYEKHRAYAELGVGKGQKLENDGT